MVKRRTGDQRTSHVHARCVKSAASKVALLSCQPKCFRHWKEGTLRENILTSSPLLRPPIIHARFSLLIFLNHPFFFHLFLSPFLYRGSSDERGLDMQHRTLRMFRFQFTEQAYLLPRLFSSLWAGAGRARSGFFLHSVFPCACALRRFAHFFQRCRRTPHSTTEFIYIVIL